MVLLRQGCPTRLKARCCISCELNPGAKEACSESPPAAQEFTFKWSGAGDAVALLRRGKPLAYVAAEQPGRSKAVAKQSPLAVPWDQRAYESLFGRH